MQTKKKKSLMMTLKRLLPFIGTAIRRDTRALGSTPNLCLTRGKRIKCSAKIRAPKRRCPLNSTGHVATRSRHGFTFNRTIGSLRRSRLFNWAEAASASQSESCVFIPKDAFLRRSNLFQLGQSRVYLMEQHPRFRPKRRIPTEGASLK